MPRLELHAVVRSLRSAFAAPVLLGVPAGSAHRLTIGLAEYVLPRLLEPIGVVCQGRAVFAATAAVADGVTIG
ncbi:MAG: hypothetical protein ACR2OO_05715 [Thermomicrobiales bacterium]